MRTSVPSALPLFRSDAQVHLLALLLLEDRGEWTLAELARRTALPVASAHRELGRAEKAGIVERDATVRPHQFRAARDSPLAEPLTQLLERTVGVETRLRELFEAHDDVLAAAIHGSWASGEAGRASDVDVIAVGTEGATALRRAARALGKAAGRRIDLTVYTPQEFAAKTGDDNGFLRLALERPLVPLKGDLREFAA